MSERVFIFGSMIFVLMNVDLVCLGKKKQTRKTLLLLHLVIKGIGLEMHCFRNPQGGKIFYEQRA